MRRVSKSQNIAAKIRKVNFAKNRKVLKKQHYIFAYLCETFAYLCVKITFLDNLLKPILPTIQ